MKKIVIFRKLKEQKSFVDFLWFGETTVISIQSKTDMPRPGSESGPPRCEASTLAKSYSNSVFMVIRNIYILTRDYRNFLVTEKLKIRFLIVMEENTRKKSMIHFTKHLIFRHVVTEQEDLKEILYIFIRKFHSESFR